MPARRPTPIQARARRDVTAVTAVRALDATPGIRPRPIPSAPQPLGAVPVRALGPAPDTRLLSSRGPALGQPISSRGPAQGQPISSRGPAQGQPISSRGPAQGQPISSRGPAQGRPTPSVRQPLGAVPVLGPAPDTTRPRPIPSVRQPLGAVPVRVLGPAPGTRPRPIPSAPQPLGAVPVRALIGVLPVADGRACIACDGVGRRGCDATATTS